MRARHGRARRAVWRWPNASGYVYPAVHHASDSGNLRPTIPRWDSDCGSRQALSFRPTGRGRKKRSARPQEIRCDLSTSRHGGVKRCKTVRSSFVGGWHPETVPLSGPRASPFDTARVRGEDCQTDWRRPCAKLKAQKHKFQTAKRVIASLKVRIRTGSILIICTLWIVSIWQLSRNAQPRA